MATTILLWDPRFPNRPGQRLTVDDGIASLAVRAGVAAAADPAAAGALASGVAVSAANLVAVTLAHGKPAQLLAIVVLPLTVAQGAVALGLAYGVPPAVAASLKVGTLDFSDPTNSNLIL